MTNLWKVRAYWGEHNSVRFEVIDRTSRSLAAGFTSAADAHAWIRRQESNS
jgi:hypothetical protein